MYLVEQHRWCPGHLTMAFDFTWETALGGSTCKHIILIWQFPAYSRNLNVLHWTSSMEPSWSLQCYGCCSVLYTSCTATFKHIIGLQVIKWNQTIKEDPSSRIVHLFLSIIGEICCIWAILWWPNLSEKDIYRWVMECFGIISCRICCLPSFQLILNPSLLHAPPKLC